jgi:LPXTG-motif cell wall-anchored protein
MVSRSGDAVSRQQRRHIVRISVRKFVGVALMAVFGALLLPMATAGAQAFIPGEGPPPTPACVVTSFSPTAPQSQAAFAAGVNVTVQGTIDTPATLTLLATPNDGGTPPNPTGPPVVLDEKAVGVGNFSISGVVHQTSTITLGITYGPKDAYAAACATAGGLQAFNVNAETATRPPAAALAFTGSSDTPSYVLIGIAAILAGAVLVVATRRRKQVS